MVKINKLYNRNNVWNFNYEITFLLFLCILVLAQQSYSTLYLLLVSELVWLIFLIKTNSLMSISNNPEFLVLIFVLLSLITIDLALGLTLVTVQHNVFTFIDNTEFSSLKKKKKVFFSNSNILLNKFKF